MTSDETLALLLWLNNIEWRQTDDQTGELVSVNLWSKLNTRLWPVWPDWQARHATSWAQTPEREARARQAEPRFAPSVQSDLLAEPVEPEGQMLELNLDCGHKQSMARAVAR